MQTLLALAGRERLHLVGQYRYPVAGRRWKFPSGIAGQQLDAKRPGWPHASGARRGGWWPGDLRVRVTRGRVRRPSGPPGRGSAPPAPWLGVVSERAQHAAVDPERLQDSERVVEGEDVVGG